jgi:MFS family permease
MILYRVGARVWLARIMISWGLISAATIFVRGPWSFYFLRFLLGAAEAGYFPGVAFYLGHWFPAEYRTRAIAWFMVAIPISSVIGGALSSAAANGRPLGIGRVEVAVHPRRAAGRGARARRLAVDRTP